MPMATTNSQDDQSLPPRAATPPLHVTWAARGITIPNFPAFSPKNIRVTSTGSISKVTWSCDGKRIAVCGTEKLARVWTPEKSFEIRNTTALLNGHSDIVDSCSWSPMNPDLLCTASSRDMRIVFWDVKSKTSLQSLNLKPKQPTKIIYSPTGRVLLVMARGGSITFLKLQQRDGVGEEWVISPEKLKTNENETEVVSCIWNHPGTTIIVGEKTGLLAYFTYPELKRENSTGAHTNGATSLALDPRGKYVATAGSDSIVNLFDTQDWRLSKTMDCTEDQINDLDFSYDGEFIAVAFSRSLEIWATETCECIHRVTQPVTPCRTIAWHPWKFILAYGGQSTHPEAVNTVRALPAAATLSFFGV